VRITLDWLGTATFRLTIDDLVVFLDAYIDRLATAPEVGLRASEVTKADFVLVGHSHFDHLAGAEIIAANTGAKIIGSNESCRVMREKGVPEAQLLPSQGGERHRVGDGVSVRVFPSVHTCLWAARPNDASEALTGEIGLCEDDRVAAFARQNPFTEVFEGQSEWARAALQHFMMSTGSRLDGGALVYLIETPIGSIFFQDSMGCWGGVLREINADVALLGVVPGRANLDGEPFQGSIAEFIALEVSALRPKTVILGHHDNWMGVPSFEPLDLAPIKKEIARAYPDAVILEPGYLECTAIREG
jgi:L-ascorbate metabolism protein UlaG (beta-lactamase superfamily)